MKHGRLMLAASEVDSDMLYASGFRAPDPFIWFECGDGQQGIVLSTLEYGRGLNEARKDVKVLRSDAFFAENDHDRSMEKLLPALARKFNIGHFETPRNFPLYYADVLRGEGVEVRACSSAFFAKRRYKSQLEVDYITEGLRAAEAAEERVVEILSEADISPDHTLIWRNEALTSEILRYEIDLVFMKHGVRADSTIVACGRHGAEPHNNGSGIIFAHLPIVVDIFPRVSATGYWGDVTRTYVKGIVPNIVRRAYEAVKEARDEAKKMIAPGVRACDVHYRARDIMLEHGFENGADENGDYGFIHGLGHGVGLDIHELPRLNASSTDPLQAGEVITVEPGLYYPQWGGIRLEDMVVVTADGCRCLNSIDTFLEIS